MRGTGNDACDRKRCVRPETHPAPSTSGIVPDVTEQPRFPSGGLDAAAPDDPTETDAAPDAQPARRLPGEPHPYMLQRNPPNLWILVWLTIFSLGLTVLIMALTVVL